MEGSPQQHVPERGFLTVAQIDQLPVQLQQHYREYTWLRDPDDLQYFPEPARTSLQRLIDRSRQNLQDRIAHEEGRQAS